MLHKNFHIHFRIINFWFTFVLFLIIISNLPHQEVPFFSWFNCSMYFLIFLQSVYLFKQDTPNRFIFLNIGLFALFHSLSFVDMFIGEGFLMGDDYLSYFFFEYRTILLSFLPALCVIYITIKYLFNELESYKVYLLSLAIILPVLLWHYHPFLLDKEYVLEVETSVFFQSVLLFDLLPLFFLVLYGIMLYKYDWSLGEHINTLMVCFFIITIMDITNQYGYINEITAFQYTQYVLLVNLSFFLVTMFRLVNHAYSDFGQFYDALMNTGNKYGVPIRRKRSTSAVLLDFSKAYFHQRRNSVGFTMLISALGINYFSSNVFIKINMAVLSFGLLVLLFYLTALYQKRINNGNILNIKHNRH